MHVDLWLAVGNKKNLFLAVIKFLYLSTQNSLGQTNHPLASVRSRFGIKQVYTHLYKNMYINARNWTVVSICSLNTHCFFKIPLLDLSLYVERTHHNFPRQIRLCSPSSGHRPSFLRRSIWDRTIAGSNQEYWKIICNSKS